MKKLFFVTILLLVTSCAYSQGFVGKLNQMMQTWERYEGLHRQAKAMKRTQITDYGTIKHKGWDNKLKSLTWVDLKFEDAGRFVNVYKPKDGQWSCIGRIDKFKPDNYTFEVITQFCDDKLYQLKVVVIVISDYIGIEVKSGNKSVESYNF